MAESPHATTMRKNFTHIADEISAEKGPAVQWFADQLVREEFLSNTDIADTNGLSPYEKASKLIRPVNQRICAPYGDTVGAFFKLIDILQSKAKFRELVKHLLKEYETYGGEIPERYSEKSVRELSVSSSGSSLSSPPSQATSSYGSSTTSSSTTFEKPAYGGEKLNIYDHAEITAFLDRLDNNAVLKLAIEFGLDYAKVKKMDSSMLLEEVVYAWLNEQGNVKRQCPPSWKNLVEALKSPRLRQTGIAHEIAEAKFCN